MHKPSPVRIYCGAVFVAGCLVVALLRPMEHLGFISATPVSFGIMALGVVLGELMPLKIPRRGDDEEIALSASFAMAILLVGGLGPALIAQAVASVAQDVNSRKPPWRIAFNLGQYALSMAAAAVVMRALTSADLGPHPFGTPQMPAVIAALWVFFLVNTGLVGTAVALYQRVPIRGYFATNIGFVFVTGGVMLLVAPIVMAAADYSIVLVPLCMAPVVAIYSSVWEGARSEHAARHDGLTGLPNRTAFHEAIGTAIRDEREPAFLLLVDLDRFKEVNDTLGHAYGDLLLQQVSERFQQQLGERDQLARLGGDEFAIIGAGGERRQAMELANRIADSLRQPMQLEHVFVDVQASVGVSLFPHHGRAVETLLQRADVAMYRAKATRSGVSLYEERHDHHSADKLMLAADLRTAVGSDQIVVWYQPEIEFTSGRVLAVEALVRWEHPRLGLLGPDDFITMAEQSNLIKPLTDQVTEIALRQLAAWRREGIAVSMAVNVSPPVLVDPEFATRVVNLLEQTGIPAARLKLEVTEGALMAEPEVARDALRQLDARGIEISIDDFGTGYSSLAYLADLPVTEVKIDRSFVRRMGKNSRESIIVSSTIDLAHHLGMRAVAEGVEHPRMLQELEQLGCDAGQGHAIARPLAAPEMTAWLRTARGPRRGGQTPVPPALVAPPR